MTRDELIEQRAELERSEAEHFAKANEARGAIRLIDYWLTRAEFQPPASDAQEREGG